MLFIDTVIGKIIVYSHPQKAYVSVFNVVLYHSGYCAKCVIFEYGCFDIG